MQYNSIQWKFQVLYDYFSLNYNNKNKIENNKIRYSVNIPVFQISFTKFVPVIK